MFQKLPGNSQKLLEEILEADDPVEMLGDRFEKCTIREDEELRGIMGELVQRGYIKVLWANNVPNHIWINNSARTYHEQLAEHERTCQLGQGTINHYTFHNAGGIMVFGDISDSSILFGLLRKQADGLTDEERIKAAIDDMEKTEGKRGFVEKYNTFIQSIANHMTIFAPWLPMLAKLLGNS